MTRRRISDPQTVFISWPYRTLGAQECFIRIEKLVKLITLRVCVCCVCAYTRNEEEMSKIMCTVHTSPVGCRHLHKNMHTLIHIFNSLDRSFYTSRSKNRKEYKNISHFSFFGKHAKAKKFLLFLRLKASIERIFKDDKRDFKYGSSCSLYGFDWAKTYIR